MLRKMKKVLSSLLVISSLTTCIIVQAAPMSREYSNGISSVLKKYGVVHNKDLSHGILAYDTKVKVMNGISNMYDTLDMYGLQDYFDPQDVTKLSGLKAEDYAKIINDTGLEGYGYAFENIEKEYKINGLFVLGICILESGWGNSPLAHDKHNYTGMSAYDGNAYASAKTFDDLEDCVDYTAERLRNNYINSDGKFYSGGKSIFHVNVYYCTQSDWSLKIVSTLREEIREHLYVE